MRFCFTYPALVIAPYIEDSLVDGFLSLQGWAGYAGNPIFRLFMRALYAIDSISIP